MHQTLNNIDTAITVLHTINMHIVYKYRNSTANTSSYLMCNSRFIGKWLTIQQKQKRNWILPFDSYIHVYTDKKLNVKKFCSYIQKISYTINPQIC